MPRYEFDAPRLYVADPITGDGAVRLDPPQVNYLINVLRLKDLDKVLIFNGRDGEWRARLRFTTRKSASLVAEVQARPQTSPGDLDLLFAPLKHARLDYMVQKAVEMGVRRLAPVITQRTQVSRLNLDRMKANAIEAAEQCGVLCLPEICEPVALKQLLADWPAERRLIFCDEDAGVADPISALRSGLGAETGRLAVLIGPEGGFADEERRSISALPRSIALSLGPRILRADTAAVAALALVQAVAGDWRDA